LTLKTYNLCLIGFGNVGRALVRLLERKRAGLREQYGIDWRLTGVATRRLGRASSPTGLDYEALLANQTPKGSATASNLEEWLQVASADVVFELSSLNHHTGQPAIDHLRAALNHGAHAITANKGPVVRGYHELRALAGEKGKRFLFESTVMDGVPIFSMFRENLPLLEVKGFRGILNSTTNIILQEMETGSSLDAAICKAQDMGIAETDPSDDLDGWDATVKVAALCIVILGASMKLEEIDREGIRSLTAEQVKAARASGRPYKLVCTAKRVHGNVAASVRPQQLSLDDPLAWVNGSSSAINFETDVFPGLAITGLSPGVEETAYGLLADFVNAVSV
jgi:homoserine dehydrogenase